MELVLETLGANDALDGAENTKMARMEARTAEVCIFTLDSTSTSRRKRDAGQLRASLAIRGTRKLDDEPYGGGALDQRRHEQNHFAEEQWEP